MRLKNEKKLTLLLDHLVDYEFRAAPTGVGLKTALELRDRGIVEIRFEGREAVYRLITAQGKRDKDTCG